MRVAIVGYGKLGKAVELSLCDRGDIELVGVFSRHAEATKQAPLYPQSALFDFKNIDCALLCLGSSSDMLEIAPKIALKFNTVDTFDNHTRINEYLKLMNENANKTCHSALVSSGWDPGFLSIIRSYCYSFLPKPYVHTVWGKGVSQGHSEVLRGIRGVRRGVAITLPKASSVSALMQGRITLAKEELHTRLCVIVADGCDREFITESVKGYPDYFAPYECKILFVSDEEFERDYACLASHQGQILASGVSGVYGENFTRFHATLECDSNPQLTAGILVSSALATVRLNEKGRYGAFTPLDVPPSYYLYNRNYFDFI